MLKHGISTLDTRIRTFGQNFFRAFGIHCATHQIRVILISCVVITSLFYPALALYSTSTAQTLAPLRVLTSFARMSNSVGSDLLQDLAEVWSKHDTFRVRENGASLTRCGLDSTLRMERILIRRAHDEDDNKSYQHNLQHTLTLQRSLQRILSSRSIPCFLEPNGHCLVLSPLAFWNHDEPTLMSDPDVAQTLATVRNVSVAGLHITPNMVLAGRSPVHEDGLEKTHADYLALTYFFPETDCSGGSGHQLWMQSLRDASPEGTLVETSTGMSALISLEYNTTNHSQTAVFLFIWLVVVIFGSYAAWSISQKTNQVHDVLGLFLTVIVEMVVSTITSLSVCALAGFKVTMVPWQLLPLIIVFVGGENMLNLLDAVGRTPVTLPVKQRIAEGLSRAGTSNTLKLVSYNTILGVIAGFSTGAIQQFCAFAIVVLVAHWFLAHTFFLTVVSIDLQRLELADLIRQDPSIAPSNKAATPVKRLEGSSIPKWQKNLQNFQTEFKQRIWKNKILLLLLASTGIIYYTTYSQSSHDVTSTPKTPSLSNLGSAAILTSSSDAAAVIWRTLNPQQNSILHVRKEMPSILTFSFEGNTMSSTTPLRYRPSIRTFRFAYWALKIVFLPIAATTVALYGILLYLLKDAELLEAQRHAEPENVTPAPEPSLDGRIFFSTLTRTFSTDIELISTSQNGNIVASVGLQNELTIWRMDTGAHVSIDTGHIFSRLPTSSSTQPNITAVAIDTLGKHLAVGTGAGLIAIWRVDDTSVVPLPNLTLNSFTSAVIDLEFVSTHSQPPSGARVVVWLMAIYGSGLVERWAIGPEVTSSHVTPSRPGEVVKSIFVRIEVEHRLQLAFCMQDGTLELVDIEGLPAPIILECSLKAGNPEDVVSHVHACRIQLDGATRLIVVAATKTGIISLWDAQSCECITVLEEHYGSINVLRAFSVAAETCRICGELPPASVLATFSVDYVVHMVQVYLPSPFRRCSCAQNENKRLPTKDSLSRHPRSGTSTPRPRSRLSSLSSTTSPFPVSGHGVHSRRASEKDARRLPSETLFMPLSAEESETSGVVGSYDPSSAIAPSPLPSPPTWRDVWTRSQADATCERGGWDIYNSRVVGVRRRSRASARGKGAVINAKAIVDGLSLPTLDRWELWMFDPTASSAKHSTLSSLVTHGDDDPAPKSVTPVPNYTGRLDGSSTREGVPRLPFTRVTPLVVNRSRLFAGFGNTVGVFDLIS